MQRLIKFAWRFVCQLASGVHVANGLLHGRPPGNTRAARRLVDADSVGAPAVEQLSSAGKNTSPGRCGCPTSGHHSNCAFKF